MKFSVFSKGAVGYKNKIKNKPSQDYFKIEEIRDSLICTVADGHSGDFFTYSHKGSKFACEAAIKVIKKYIDKDINKIESLLEDKQIQIDICNEWRALVDEDMKGYLPVVFKKNYFKYGTTLLLAIITEEYILYLKLGDGDILIKQDNYIKRVLPLYKKYIVDCLAEEKAYDKMIYKIMKYEKGISNIIIYSDGFENSFNLYSDMVYEINNTLLKYNKNIFSKMKLEKNYSKYLSELSKNVSLDDISIIFVNIL